LEHDVASGEVIVEGTRHSVSATTVTLSAANSDPRKDVIYVDSTGSVAVAEGTTASAKPSGETGRDTYQPSPPDLSGTAACPLAEIWVGGGVSDTGGSDISDRRVFADITAGSVDAQSVSDTIYFAQSSETTISELNQLITDVSNAGGGVVAPVGTFTVDQNTGQVFVQDDVILDGMEVATFQLADSQNDNAPTIIQFDANVTNAGVRNLEVDGNAANQDAGTVTKQTRAQSGIAVHDPAGGGTAEHPSDCFVENVYSHDTIRNNIVLGGDGHRVEHVTVGNSLIDHWIYFAQCQNAHVEDVDGEGYFNGSAFPFGGNANPVRANTLKDVSVSNLADSPSGSAADRIVHFRPQDGADDEDNTVENIDIDGSGYAQGTVPVLYQHPDCTVENLTYRGPNDQNPVITLDAAADRATLKDSTVEITASTLGFTAYLVRLRGEDQAVQNCDLIENTGSTVYRTIWIVDDDRQVVHPVVENCLLAGERFNAIRLVGGNGNGVTDVIIRDNDLQTDQLITQSGDFLHGIPSVPQDLAGQTGLYTGHHALDDGTNVSTSGPMLCVWTGSAWQPSDGGATFS
jgi:hypothetical protein